MSYQIFYKNADPVIVFAATELKKYLRMMMPRCGEIPTVYDPEAKTGFRLGLMSEFGLDPDVKDARLDDVLYADADEQGGIIAGSNTRSVLLSVYRYLKELGCMWLFPGPDGEVIPNRASLSPVKLHHKASCRYRGQCNEGSETQPLMKDAIDFTPKVGLNTFMIEFDIPRYYYERAYHHQYDSYHAEAPLSNETILRWKRECEAEIAKRGLLFHDMGHGWTAEPFGFDSTSGWVKDKGETLPEEKRKYLARINGVRDFFGGVALNTNVCMSNPEARGIMARYIADYAQTQNNVDFLHVWLADASNNHCECEECQKKDTSDWYVMLLNDIDEELTKRNSDTHIVFIAYVDTLWAPKTETIRNTERFTMLFAPITRLYTESYLKDADPSAMPPYTRNKLVMPKGTAATFAFLEEWQKMWKGDCFCYEYYFWLACYYDMGTMYLARIIYDDIHGLKKHGLSGIVEDGTQRGFFPNGFCFYVYSEAMLDTSKSFETLVEEYYSAAYGRDWNAVVDYMTKLSYTADFGFAKGERSVDKKIGSYYNPDMAEIFKKLPAIVDEFLPTIEAHLQSDKRWEYVSWEILKWHADYVKILSKGLAAIAVNDRETSTQAFVEIAKKMEPLQYLRNTVYDHDLCCSALRRPLDPDRRYKELFNG